MRKLTALQLIALCILFSALSAAQEAGPQKVASHWSAYDYPEEIPEGTRVHIISKGETLWQLAQQYYDNPLAWPQIHDANRYIKNPNLIYPGDPVVLPDLNIVDPGEVRTAEMQQDSETSDSEDGEDGEPAQVMKQGDPLNLGEQVRFEVEPRQSRKYELAVGTYEMYCCPVVYGKKIKPQLWIAGSEENDQIEIQPYDIVYINRGKGHVEPNDIFVASHYVQEVHRKSDSEFVGYGYHEVGLVKVQVVLDDFAVAEVISACDGLRVGAILTPYEEQPIPVTRKFDRLEDKDRYARWTAETVNEIVWSHYQTLELSTSDIICVELPEDNQYEAGDHLVFFKYGKLHRLYSERDGTLFSGEKMKDDGSVTSVEYETFSGYERNRYNVAHVEGFGVVMKTTDVVAVVKIVQSSRGLHVGDFTGNYAFAESASGR